MSSGGASVGVRAGAPPPDVVSTGLVALAGVCSIGERELAIATSGSIAVSVSGIGAIAAITSSPVSFDGSGPPALVTRGGDATGGSDARRAGESISPSGNDDESSGIAVSSPAGADSSAGETAGPTGGAVASMAGPAASTGGGMTSTAGGASSPDETATSWGATAGWTGEAAVMAGVEAASAGNRFASKSPKPDASATAGPCGLAGWTGAIMERMACADMVPRGVAGAMVAGALAAPDIQRRQRKSRASSPGSIKFLKTKQLIAQTCESMNHALGPNLPCGDVSCPAPALGSGRSLTGPQFAVLGGHDTGSMRELVVFQ